MLSSPTLKSLVLWDKPNESAVVVTVLLSFLLIFGVMDYTLLTFICRCTQLAMVGYGALVYLGKAPASREELVRRASAWVERAHPYVLAGASNAAKIVTWENRTASTEVLMATIFLGFLGNIFSDLTLLFLATIGFFVVPLMYIKNKTLVDEQLVTLKKKFGHLLDHGAAGVSPVMAGKKDQ
jgi:hypothetical protein